MKKFLILGVILCASFANIFATGDCTQHYVETHNPGYGGSVSAEQSLSDNCVWTITALPVVGYSFAGWNDGVTTNPRTITLDSEDDNITYTATFLPVTHDDPATGGKIIAEQVDECEWRITAVPSDGYAFLKWEDDSFTNPRTITGAMITEQESYTATFITADAAIDSWTADSKMVVRTKSVNLGTSTATIYTNGTQRATGLALTKTDEGYWSIPASLNTYAGQPLKIIFNCGGNPVSAIDSIVPYVVAANTNISSISANTDIEVVSGTLTMDAASKTIASLDIYPDAKAVVPTGKSLAVNAIYMRANALTDKYPQLVAIGGITNASDTIYYDYTLNYTNYYPLAVPYDVLCSNIRTHSGKTASYEVQYYDGATRASSGAGWEVLNDQAVGARLNAGQGYIVFAVPYKWNGTRQSRVTVRFPMVADLSSGEAEKSKVVSLYNGEVPADRNWNFLGNPYLAAFTTADNNLIMEEDGVRYITTTGDYYRTYTQSRADEGIVIKPFNTFFIQAAAAGDLVFTLSQRALSAPSRSNSAAPADELAYGLILRSTDSADRTGLLYGDTFTDNYEMNADLVKLSGSSPVLEFYSLAGNDMRAFNALPAADITRPVPLGFRNAQTGEMVIAFDSDHYAAEPLQAVMLTDRETGRTVNLLDSDYRFTTDRAQSNERFTVYALRAPDTTTGLNDHIGRTSDQSTTVNIYDILGRRLSGDRLPQGIHIIMQNGQSRKEIIR